MSPKVFSALKFLHVVDYCPNCDSAWTGGNPDPANRTFCMVCGDRKGKITGWVWGKAIDPFCWIGRLIVDRNFEYYQRNKQNAK
jgi:hypothetical protein